MGSSSSLTRFFTLLLALACIGCAGALDVAFDTIQCDESLPAFALADNVQMTCNDGESTRCSFGQDVLITGSLQYQGLDQYIYNNTGYASANLRLLSVEYKLFEDHPINFCGDWIETTSSSSDCATGDGSFYFNIPYTLPYDDDDITTWFATGWSGVSTLQVRSNSGNPLSDCRLSWHTYVTPSEEEGWKTMPSSAQSGIVLASVLTAILCCCTYITCCRKRKKHVTDENYYNQFGDYEVYEEKRRSKKNGGNNLNDMTTLRDNDVVEASRRK